MQEKYYRYQKRLSKIQHNKRIETFSSLIICASNIYMAANRCVSNSFNNKIYDINRRGRAFIFGKFSRSLAAEMNGHQTAT